MSAPELVEVKADCPNCGSKRFNEWTRFVIDGRVRVKRRCRDCGARAWVLQVKMSEVSEVVLVRKAE